MKFRAAILVESRKPLVIDEIESLPLEAGQVLVKVHCSGICGAQINEIDAVKGEDKFLPHLLGHEGGGTVVEVGAGVSRVKPGQRVVMHWRKAEGINAKPAKYLWAGRNVNSGWVTTFSDYSVVSENRVTPVSDTTPVEIAALMGCAVTTAFGIVNNDANLKVGESVVVLGCGGLGLAVLMAAKAAGAWPIIGVDIKPEKLEWSRQMGADETVLYTSKAQLVQDIGRLLPRGVDVCIENTGLGSMIEYAYETVKDRTGRVILAGVPDSREKVCIHTLPLHFGKILTGSEGGQTQPDRDIPRILSFTGAKNIDLSALISHRFPLEKINEGLLLMRSGGTKRVLIENAPNGNPG